MTTLSSGELMAATGLTARQLDYWRNQGIISPVGPRSGSGNSSRWSPELVAPVRVLVAVVSKWQPIGGLAPLGDLTRRLRERPELLDAELLFVTIDGVVTAVPRPGSVCVSPRMLAARAATG